MRKAALMRALVLLGTLGTLAAFAGDIVGPK